MKLAIITTHPIQYNAPLFAMLTARQKIAVKVFYTWENSQNGIFDKQFARQVKWDIPLLQGYDYEFVKNAAKEQGSHHRRGMINPTLIKDIENWQADAVLIFAWNFESHFKAMRYFKGKIPVLFRGDSTLLDEKFGVKSLMRRVALKFVYRYIDYALYVGTNNKQYFLKHGVVENQLIYAPHSIDNKRFADKDYFYKSKAEKWRKELNLSESDIVFLFAGKFEPKKNPLLLIEAAKSLPNYKFILAGSGNLYNSIKSASGNLQNIILLPFQNQSKMPVLYRLADAFILPSQGAGETWGLAINEAMACQRAIFASDKVGAAVDLIENGKNGYIFKSNQVADLVGKIENLNKQQLREMGKYSSKMIESFDFEQICIAIENLVNNI